MSSPQKTATKTGTRSSGKAAAKPTKPTSQSRSGGAPAKGGGVSLGVNPPQLIKVENLLLDPLNPRLSAGAQGASQDDLLKVLWTEFAVDEIAFSIAANGFFTWEALFATKHGKDKYYVTEGNRRLAAVILLLDAKKRAAVGATDLPTISAALRTSLESLPVMVCGRTDYWQYLGFKHVNGPQAWTAESKAEYIAWVMKSVAGATLDGIATTIGDRHQTVTRMFRAKMVLEQAQDAGVFDREKRWKKHFSFSHLYTGLGYAGVQKFLGLKEGDAPHARNPVPKAKLRNLGEFLGWVYGVKTANQQPLVHSQNPDLRELDEVLQSTEGVVALRRGLPLPVSLDIARGDERLFRESVQGAKMSLQRALGTIITGYGGETEVLHTCQEIVDLSAKLLSEADAIKRSHSKGKK